MHRVFKKVLKNVSLALRYHFATVDNIRVYCYFFLFILLIYLFILHLNKR